MPGSLHVSSKSNANHFHNFFIKGLKIRLISLYQLDLFFDLFNLLFYVNCSCIFVYKIMMVINNKEIQFYIIMLHFMNIDY